MSKLSAIAAPAQLSLPTDLPQWQGTVGDDEELNGYEINKCDLGHTTRLWLEQCRLNDAILTGGILEKLELIDVAARKIEAAGLRALRANLLRVAVQDSRLTGADFGEARFEDVVFTRIKLDEAGFRFATFKRVRFEQCVLRKADFSGAKLAHVTFAECEFEETVFDSARCTAVDIRGQNIATVKGVQGLRGARMSGEQLIQIAPLLAAELGFIVSDEA